MRGNSELREALQLVRPYAWRSFAFALIAALLVLAPTIYMMEVYDRVVNSRSLLTLGMLTLMVLGVYVLMEVLEWAANECMREAGEAVDERLSPRIFQAIFKISLVRGASLQPMNDLRTLREFLYNPVLNALMGAPAAGVFGLILFVLDPLIGWAALLGALVQVLLAWLNERNSRPELMAANRASIGAQTYADASLRNAEVIEAMGMLKNIHHRWYQMQRDFLSRQARASEYAGGFQSATKFVQNTLSSGLLGLGAWLLIENPGSSSGGLIIVGSTLGGRMLAPLVQVVGQWRAVVQVRDAWQRLSELLQKFPPDAEQMSLPAPHGPLTVEAVTAGAPGTPTPIVRGLQFAVQPGEVLAVIGPSASGKSTLARLLVGLWPTSQGKVRLDGADVHQWNKTELGPHLGYLPQDVELLDGSVADNIARFGAANAKAVEQAASLVGLHDWIQSLPQGYDTPLGRDGATLSGGQRQRIGLARALYGSPALVVLDEPNASLDEAGDRALVKALEQAKAQGCIVVLITHRKNVLAVVDKLLFLRDGTMVAFGPRDEVLANLNAGGPAAAGPANGRPSGPRMRGPQPLQPAN